MKAWTRRDLTIVPMGTGDCIVIACDSCGAIGNKKEDAFPLAPHYVGKFTARVALTEVLCSGALPITITNGVACEMHPTGEEIMAGIGHELKNANIADVVITGSTEENFTTSMTALAVTVIGTAKESDLRFGSAVKNDKLILLGSPAVGTEVNLDSSGFYREIRELLAMPSVKEIVPVGSKGIAYEAETLASLNEAALELYDTGMDYRKSAGPATCLLVLCADSGVQKILSCYESAALIGEIQ